ncbi:IPTL-CTERM sorting domain-containing protein [Brevundimonas staleyi]|uniref:IPTL-CTERM sorting domain-containing protein n=1 Tax=Brevundimonas staleyi TaxID=74326 RepID=A0ABW0FTZ0_9CAUL
MKHDVRFGWTRRGALIGLIFDVRRRASRRSAEEGDVMAVLRSILGLLALGLGLIALPVAAQTLVAPGAVDNAVQGQFFDLPATNDVTITGLTFRRIETAGTYRVYGRAGSHVGATQSSTGWTLLATGPMAAGDNITFPTPFSFGIPAGQTRSLYVVANEGRQGYRTSSTFGAVIASDANLAILEGTGQRAIGGDFTDLDFSPRAFIGTVHYSLGLPPVPAPVPTLSEWAMILLGLMLAGGAAVMIRRRAEAA